MTKSRLKFSKSFFLLFPQLFFLPFLFLFLFLFLFCGCTSYSSKFSSTADLYSAKKYSEALSSLEDLSILKADRNRLLYLLEKATILDEIPDYSKSRSTFIEADKLADRLYTQSLTKNIASFLYNDTTTDYSGEDYEKITIHTMLALSFLKERNIGSALIEARKINNKLYEIISGYNHTSYKEDAFARYLSGLIYEAKSEYDNAIIDYKKALTLYESGYFKVTTPSYLVESLYTLLKARSRQSDITALIKKYPYLKQLSSSPSEASIVTIRKSGLISKKVSRSFSFGVGDQIVSFSYPVIVDVSASRNQERSIIINGTIFTKEQLVQDMNLIARDTLEEKRLRLIAKTSSRAVLRAGMSHELKKNGSDVALLANLVLQISSIFTEQADTRSWNLCPSSFYISRTKVKPGKYNLRFINQNVDINLEPKQIYFLVE